MTPIEPTTELGCATMVDAARAARYDPDAPTPRMAATSGFLAASRSRARNMSSLAVAEPPGESMSSTTAGTRSDSRRRRTSSIQFAVRSPPPIVPNRRSTTTRSGRMRRIRGPTIGRWRSVVMAAA